MITTNTKEKKILLDLRVAWNWLVRTDTAERFFSLKLIHRNINIQNIKSIFKHGILSIKSLSLLLFWGVGWEQTSENVYKHINRRLTIVWQKYI